MAERNLVKVFVPIVAALLVGVFVFTRYELVLRVRKPVDVRLKGELPARAKLAQRIDVHLDERLAASAAVESLEVPLDEELEVPLDLDLALPIKAEVRISKPLPIKIDVPIKSTLSEKELGRLEFDIPLDTSVYVDDVVLVDTVIPLDTHVRTALGIKVPVKAEVPIRTRVPIRQKVKLKDRVHVAIDHFRFPLNTVIHVDTQVPLDDVLVVTGTARARVKQKVKVPLKQTLHPVLRSEVPVSVRIAGAVPAEVSGEIATSVRIDQAVPTELGPVHVSFGDLDLAPKR